MYEAFEPQNEKHANPTVQSVVQLIFLDIHDDDDDDEDDDDV